MKITRPFSRIRCLESTIGNSTTLINFQSWFERNQSGLLTLCVLFIMHNLLIGRQFIIFLLRKDWNKSTMNIDIRFCSKNYQITSIPMWNKWKENKISCVFGVIQWFLTLLSTLSCKASTRLTMFSLWQIKLYKKWWKFKLIPQQVILLKGLKNWQHLHHCLSLNRCLTLPVLTILLLHAKAFFWED